MTDRAALRKAVHSLCFLAWYRGTGFPADPALGDFDQLLQIIVNEPDPNGAISLVGLADRSRADEILRKRARLSHSQVPVSPDKDWTPEYLKGRPHLKNAATAAVIHAAAEAAITHDDGMVIRLPSGELFWDGYVIKMSQKTYPVPTRIHASFNPGPLTMLDLMWLEPPPGFSFETHWDWLDWFYGEVKRQFFRDVFGEDRPPPRYNPDRPPKVISLEAVAEKHGDDQGIAQFSNDDDAADVEPFGVSTSALAEYQRIECEDWLRRLMARYELSGIDRSILWRLWEGVREDEIARSLGVGSYAALRKRVQRLRERLFLVREGCALAQPSRHRTTRVLYFQDGRHVDELTRGVPFMVRKATTPLEVWNEKDGIKPVWLPTEPARLPPWTADLEAFSAQHRTSVKAWHNYWCHRCGECRLHFKLWKLACHTKSERFSLGDMSISRPASGPPRKTYAEIQAEIIATDLRERRKRYQAERRHTESESSSLENRRLPAVIGA